VSKLICIAFTCVPCISTQTIGTQQSVTSFKISSDQRCGFNTSKNRQNMSNPPDFQIINALHAHDGPIRCATIRNNGEIITGCQSDAPNFRRWSQNADSVEEIGESVSHDHWVTAITSLAEDISRDFFPEVSYVAFLSCPRDSVTCPNRCCNTKFDHRVALSLVVKTPT